MLWGRSVFNSIRKFLQFQLTVNFVALVVAFVGAIIGGRIPLNVLQVGARAVHVRRVRRPGQPPGCACFTTLLELFRHASASCGHAASVPAW